MIGSSPATDDAALLVGLRAGEPAAFETLVRRESPRLLAVSRRFLRDEEDARDAVQEAFLSAFKSLSEFEGGSQIGTWLHRIAVNACLMKLRTRKRRPEGRGGRNLVTTHGPESYPGLLVVKPGPDWQVWVIVPEDGQTVRAVGGERTYGYETVDGGRAEGFELRAGDRATLVRSGLPFSLVEWRIERARAA